MHVTFEVCSFNRIGAISILRPNWSDWLFRYAQTHGHADRQTSEENSISTIHSVDLAHIISGVCAYVRLRSGQSNVNVSQSNTNNIDDDDDDEEDKNNVDLRALPSAHLPRQPAHLPPGLDRFTVDTHKSIGNAMTSVREYVFYVFSDFKKTWLFTLFKWPVKKT